MCRTKLDKSIPKAGKSIPKCWKIYPIDPESRKIGPKMPEKRCMERLDGEMVPRTALERLRRLSPEPVTPEKPENAAKTVAGGTPWGAENGSKN